MITIESHVASIGIRGVSSEGRIIGIINHIHMAKSSVMGKGGNGVNTKNRVVKTVPAKNSMATRTQSGKTAMPKTAVTSRKSTMK